jgi:hypothetical protein
MKTTVDGLSLDDGMFHLQSTRSLNNRLVIEAYKKEGLRANVQHGFARLDQKLAVKGLTILMDAKLNDGTFVPKGSKAYIREETLHTAPWAQKILESDLLGQPFMITDLANVEFIEPPTDPAA